MGLEGLDDEDTEYFCMGVCLMMLGFSLICVFFRGDWGMG